MCKRDAFDAIINLLTNNGLVVSFSLKFRGSRVHYRGIDRSKKSSDMTYLSIVHEFLFDLKQSKTHM